MPLSPWQQASQAVDQSGLGTAAQNIAIGLARQRYLQEQFAQQMRLRERQLISQEMLNKQHGALFEAQTGAQQAQRSLDAAKETAIKNAEQARGELGDASWAIGMANAFPKTDYHPGISPAPFIARAMDAMSRLPDRDRSRLPVNIAQMLQLPDPATTRMMALGEKSTVNVPSGSTMVDLGTGEPVYQSPRTIPQGSVVTDLRTGQRVAEGLPPRVPANAGQVLSKNIAIQILSDASKVAQLEMTDPRLVDMVKFVATNEVAGAQSPRLPAPGTPTSGPAPGTIDNGFEFIGGDPGKKENWKPVINIK